MTAKKNTRWLLTAMLLGLIAVLSCNNGGGDSTPDPSAVGPSITGLDRNAANIGDTVEVYGINFGENQSGGSVKLNNADFTVTTWTDTQLDIVVVPGMVSGIVVVTVNSLASQSGTEAQLFIPAAPGGTPLISALSPDYGVPDQVVLVTGNFFGSDPAAGNVFFAAQVGAGGVSQASGVVAAEVVSVDIGGTLIPQWGPNAIKVKVPWTATTGDVYVEVGGEQSNMKPFTWLPPPPSGAPVITEITPTEGPIGTDITITGDNFGHNQGGTLLKIGTLNLTVSSWTNTLIEALIPNGATTNPIAITVGMEKSNEILFTVGNLPVITGVSPSQVRVGQAFTVYGHNFGYSQNSGSLMVGGTAQPATIWNNELVHVDNLIAMSATGSQLEVMVLADNGDELMESNIVIVTRVSDLTVRMTVDPQAGQRHNPQGEEGTEFTFRVTVSGGSGSYGYYLIPDVISPSETTYSTTNEIIYTYPHDPSADDQMEIDTQVRVEDTITGDTRTVDGPTLLLVNHGVPVITKIEVSDFSRGNINAPNDWCYLNTDGSYHDFSFLGTDRYFTSSLGSVLILGSPLQPYTRDLEAFMTGYATSRPYGYRYYGATGGGVVIRGLNFGATEGELWLNVTGDAEQVTGIGSWEDTAVTFNVPQVNKGLSGIVRVVISGTGGIAESTTPLITSAYATQVLPEDELDKDIGIVTVLGFDFQPTQVAEMTGPGIFAIWTVRAEYPNPWGAGDLIGPALAIQPVPAATIQATTLTFDMASLDPDGDGDVEIEVHNALGDAAQVVEGTLVDGDYFFFLWTGVLMDGTNDIVANSGIFSETYMVTCGDPGPPPGDPVAHLICTPSSGPEPLDVVLNASGSTDDGTIVEYAFKFGDAGPGEAWFIPVPPTTAVLPPHTYTGVDIHYTAEVRVTDNDANIDTAEADVYLTNGGGGSNEIRIHAGYTNPDAYQHAGAWQVFLYDTEFPDPVGDPPQFPPTPPNPINMISPSYPMALIGTIATALFEDVPDGNNYWVLIYKGDLIDWDPATAGDQLWVKLGPITVPPAYDSLDIMGVQLHEPLS